MASPKVAGTAPMPAPTAPQTNGKSNGYHAPAFADGEEPEPSSYLKYLPAIYSGDEFVGRFLRIFEDVLDPISVQIDNQPYYFDPMTTPRHILDWMDAWVDMDDEAEDWPLPKRRALIAAAAVLYRMRGTTSGIKQHMGIYAGGLTLIQERTNGFRLTRDARLGINTSIGENKPRVFTVTVAVPNPEELDMDVLRSIVEQEKPVDTTYVLRVVKLNVKQKKRAKRF